MRTADLRPRTKCKIAKFDVLVRVGFPFGQLILQRNRWFKVDFYLGLFEFTARNFTSPYQIAIALEKI